MNGLDIMNNDYSFGKNGFRDNNELTDLVIPNGVKRIGESCFENCRNLQSVVIPDSVVGIHKRAFYECESLKEVQLPAALQNIPEDIFFGCRSLQRIVLPESVKYISNNAFAGCVSLAEVVFDDSREIRISNTAFEGCTALKFENAVAIAGHFVKPLSLVIHNRATGIEGRLKTFAEREFLFDRVECSSIESVLEAFKFEDINDQIEIAGMPAWDAYQQGQREDAMQWQTTRMLYWNGRQYNRDGEEYQELLKRLFFSIFEQDAQFRLDVAFLKNASVMSKVGGINPQTQVMTKKEYIANLLAFSGSTNGLVFSVNTARSELPVVEKEYTRDQEAIEIKKQKSRKIVVMGGSFNPPTIAHEKLMLAAVNQLSADKGIFVPSSDAYVRRKMSKSEGSLVLPEEQRLALLQKVCESDPRLKVSTCEYQDDGRGHTFDTLQKIQEEYPDALLYFLIGADKLTIIPRWNRNREFFETFDFAVVQRNGTAPRELIRQNKMLSAYEEIFHMVEEPEGISEISSTAVRNMLKEGNSEVRNLLSEGVYEMLADAVRKTDITSFRGDYDFLSNFYEAGIDYKGIHYLNNEAAFQAQKCMTEEEKWEFSYLSAGKSKRRGRQVTLRPDWEQVKVGIMEEIVRAKFTQHPELAARLLATGERKLVEGNTWHDTCWGVDTETGKGENHLGKILMKVREELRRLL